MVKSKHVAIWGTVAMTGSLVAAMTVLAQPRPSPTPVSWELIFKPSPPMRVQVDTGKGPATYWYMIYTVVNNTGQDIDFFPEVVRVSEIDSELPGKGTTTRPDGGPGMIVEEAVVGIHPKVFQAIKQLYAKTQPYLVPPVEAIGRLLQGQDNARTSLVVFSDVDPRASKFTIYFAGLSGEQVSVPNPRYDPKRVKKGDKPERGQPAKDQENPEFFVLRKTLAMPYTLPGDAKTRPMATPAAGALTWVMR
jgi:hypothetical protein